MKYCGWRRAELATWLKWVPVVEQLEFFRGDTPEDFPGLDTMPEEGYIDTLVSVSALSRVEGPYA